MRVSMLRLRHLMSSIMSDFARYLLSAHSALHFIEYSVLRFKVPHSASYVATRNEHSNKSCSRNFPRFAQTVIPSIPFFAFKKVPDSASYFATRIERFNTSYRIFRVSLKQFKYLFSSSLQSPGQRKLSVMELWRIAKTYQLSANVYRTSNT